MRMNEFEREEAGKEKTGRRPRKETKIDVWRQNRG